MSIICALYRAPDTTLQTLREQPEYFQDFARLGEPPFRYEVKPGLFGRLLGHQPRVVQLGHDKLPFPEIGEDHCLSLDKAWHVMHYLMTGQAQESDVPLGFLLSGGDRIGVQDPGCDLVPRAFTAGRVREMHEALERLGEQTIRERFDWPEMMRQQVYPEIRATERMPADLWENYSGHLGHLREFLRISVGAQHGLAVATS